MKQQKNPSSTLEGLKEKSCIKASKFKTAK